MSTAPTEERLSPEGEKFNTGDENEVSEQQQRDQSFPAIQPRPSHLPQDTPRELPAVNPPRDDVLYQPPTLRGYHKHYLPALRHEKGAKRHKIEDAEQPSAPRLVPVPDDSEGEACMDPNPPPCMRYGDPICLGRDSEYDFYYYPKLVYGKRPRLRVLLPKDEHYYAKIHQQEISDLPNHPARAVTSSSSPSPVAAAQMHETIGLEDLAPDKPRCQQLGMARSKEDERSDPLWERHAMPGLPQDIPPVLVSLARLQRHEIEDEDSSVGATQYHVPPGQQTIMNLALSGQHPPAMSAPSVTVAAHSTSASAHQSTTNSTISLSQTLITAYFLPLVT